MFIIVMVIGDDMSSNIGRGIVSQLLSIFAKPALESSTFQSQFRCHFLREAFLDSPGLTGFPLLHAISGTLIIEITIYVTYDQSLPFPWMLASGGNHTCLVRHCILGQCMRPGGNICQMNEWIFRTAATLKYISHSSFNYSPSFAFRFQKLNIPCLQLEINHTIERILQYYVAELEATKKASIMFINRTELFIQKEKYAASICHHYLVPNLLDWG